jgi:hypothetical protein
MVEKAIEKLAQMSRKTKTTIVIVVLLAVAAVVVFLVIDNQQKQAIVDEIKTASESFEPAIEDSPMSNPLNYLIGDSDAAGYGLSLDDTDVEVLARAGDWVAVKAISLRMSNYGSQFYAVYQKIDGVYQHMAGDISTNRDDYADLNIPGEIFDAIERDSLSKSNGKVQSILEKSPDKTYPIINSLPIINDYYKITYGFAAENDVDTFYIYINAKYGYNNAAVNNIINAGFDPGDYVILFNYDAIKYMLGGD